MQKARHRRAFILYRIIFAYSPQISPFPCNHSFTSSVVTDFGLSIGNPSARSQHRLANTPSALLTPNNTV